MSEWIEKPSVINDSNGSSVLRTYTVHVKVGSPYPCPHNATPRMIGDEFVWERLIQTKGRAKAVEQASTWFRDAKKRDYAKALKNKGAHECLTVDDKAKESNFGSDFQPNKSVNRLLDKETITRLLEESKGSLKVCDRPYQIGQSKPYPSIDWVDGASKVNKKPIKIGLNYSNPKGGMEDELKKANKKAKSLKKQGKTWLREATMGENRRLINKMREDGIIKKAEYHIPEEKEQEIREYKSTIKSNEARIKELEKRLKEKGVIV